ncbi:MAG: DUF2220 family protein [Betaproteobacteria bacterium]|nr:DUF2220 family protein [Betaproteobacteria bacterium]
MNWTTSAGLRAQVQKLWDRGDVLIALLSDEPLFPKRLTLKVPSSAEMSDHFEAVREWRKALSLLRYCRVEQREFNHRVLGTNVMPQAAWIDSVEAACAWVGKTSEVEQFRHLITITQQRQPALLSWLAKRPLRALELAEQWEPLLDVVMWVQQHPRPNIYLRQVDIPGVHSKFIEAHRAVLAEWLDLTLPAECILSQHTGVTQFAARYGFRDKPVRLRFRVLDPNIIVLPDVQCPDMGSISDISLDAESFARLRLPVQRVFITENETNFLAFPRVNTSMVIFGAGYGWEALAQARWLKHCDIHYWGDIDTHGFAILNQLRTHFEHVQSLLMDKGTLLAHEVFWGQEDQPIQHDLPGLNTAERELYNDLRDNRIKNGLRLEQERIGYAWLKNALSKVFG